MEVQGKKRFRILVADDERTTLALYRKFLCSEKDKGNPHSARKTPENEFFGKGATNSSAFAFDLVTCAQGDEVVEAVKTSIEEKEPFSVAFLDVSMPPGPDGILTAEQIRSLDSNVEIVIVTAISHIDLNDIARRILPAHKLLYLQKPFHPQEIRQLASALCSKWFMERELHEYRERLEMLVEERTSELSEANIRLEREIDEHRQAEKALCEREANILTQNMILSSLMREGTFYDGNFDNSIRKITETGAHTLKVERSSLWLLNRDQSRLLCTDLYEMTSGRHSQGMAFSASDYPMYFEAVKNKRSIAAIDARSDPRTKEFAETYLIPRGITSVLYAPVWLGGRMRGILCHEHIGPVRKWSAQDQSFAGSLTDLISMIMEMSARKQAQKENERLVKDLARSEKMEAIGTLAGGVAHDLNNVLAGIVSYPDLLLMQLPEDSPLRKPILTMKETGKKATAIVQDLLTLARRGVAVEEVVDLNSVIQNYLESPEYEKLKSFHPGVEVVTDLDAGLPDLLGSPVHLYKTLMNLVSNAAEAMPQGGLLSIATKNQYLDRPVKGYDQLEERDYVVLSVADTGTGISSEDIDRIFEPFYTKKKMGKSGTGLGMAVVWGTVKDHKGYIDVKSTKEEGTTFTLYFPVTRKKRSKDQKSTPMEDYRGKGESVLVVDDMKEQRDVTSTILSELGYAVNSVASGEEAVEYLKHESADLLVLDMIMDPGMDGLDTYKQILKFRPGQRAIIASGFSETDRVKQAQRLGAGQYVRKPYSLEKIGLAVKVALRKT